jgi:hypothetical protein
MSIFWVNGEFSHIKLYVHENMSHSMWEDFRGQPGSVSDRFNVTRETIELEF